MRKCLLHILHLTWATGILSCAYRDEETLYPSQPCDTTQVTYSLVVSSIIANRCYDCHDLEAAVSGIPLEGYDQLKSMVDAGRLIGALRHQGGFSPMPKDREALQECEILQIEKWISAGAPDN